VHVAKIRILLTKIRRRRMVSCACRTHGALKQSDCLPDLGVEGAVIFKWMLMGVWADWGWGLLAGYTVVFQTSWATVSCCGRSLPLWNTLDSCWRQPYKCTSSIEQSPYWTPDSCWDNKFPDYMDPRVYHRSVPRARLTPLTDSHIHPQTSEAASPFFVCLYLPCVPGILPIPLM